jgi:hypothetical protein
VRENARRAFNFCGLERTMKWLRWGILLVVGMAALAGC